MADNARGVHVSPGVYSREFEITYAAKSLGITTLGVAGETLRGPAFQPMPIANWREFEDTFGGTSTEKFKGTNYPKYELPYIAKSFLAESKQMQVCRVLGLSGYNAGPAWAVTVSLSSDSGETKAKYVVALLRSRGSYDNYRGYTTGSGNISADTCVCSSNSYDNLLFDVGELNGVSACSTPKLYNMDALKIGQYTPLASNLDDCTNTGDFNSAQTSYNISDVNYGKFTLKGVAGKHSEEEVTNIMETGDWSRGFFAYSVSLNPSDSDYIIKVLGTNPNDGNTHIYVEALYDVALRQLIEDGKVDVIDSGLTPFHPYYLSDWCALEPVDSILTINENLLKRRHVGKRYLADAAAKKNRIGFVEFDYKTNEPSNGSISGSTGVVKVGHIYTVIAITDDNGDRKYVYRAYSENSISGTSPYMKVVVTDKLVNGSKASGNTSSYDHYAVLVLNHEDGFYYRLNSSSDLPTFNASRPEGGLGNSFSGQSIDELVEITGSTNQDVYSAKTTEDIVPVTMDLNNYRSSYRFASTPWIISNVKGDYKHILMNKLFRFHTISDGDSSNYEVKVSIENVSPSTGTFDVVVRDINDADESILPLEKFYSCTMDENNKNYIANKIGSFDGTYESKSKYITVEVYDSSEVRNSVPAGFLGYPMHSYGGAPVVGNTKKTPKNPPLKYNTEFYDDIKNRKQYFGLSTWVGVDIDAFTFKGNMAYSDDPLLMTPGFHLDSRINTNSYAKDQVPTILVDGESGYTFNAVDVNNRTNTLYNPPIIAPDEQMIGSIYEYKNLRKFTVYFYGGFDGWDIYRNKRTNTDDYKMSQYSGTFGRKNGLGVVFNKIADPESIGLNQNGITSDWYAYLAAYRQFANPEAVDINVFATPGIDYVNNKLLVNEVIDMIEEERADSIYVVTTPDKPAGEPDYSGELYTPEDAVFNLEDSEIDSNYTCTYYPWAKYYDQDNGQYIFLPTTRDVVRNFAKTDNTAYPWFAPAGMERGNVDCVKARYVTKLADEDTLYENRINPIKTFANDGVKIWGQKNLQIADGQLNRIAVRRLLLRMRKLIAIGCLNLIFEPNDPTTKNSFLSIVTPIMDNIRANRGISDYKIEVDDSVEGEDCRELNCKIFFKPYCALEYISLDFVVTPEGVSFENI